jgi:SAM-dependent methyltransferase
MSEDFKHQSAHYLAFRPTYPPELFAWLATCAQGTNCAWDCATGSGQAAVGLAKHFQDVVATDLQQNQINHALSHSKVRYVCAPAEDSSLEQKSIDLITVACAIHWFNIESFYAHVKNVLKPNGVIAVWTYEWPWTGVESIDHVLKKLKDEILKSYWPAESTLYLEKYKNLEFPFSEIEAPSFHSTFGSSASELLGFLSTWSPVQRYRTALGDDPIDLVAKQIQNLWIKENVKGPFKLPLYMRVGRLT